MLRRLIDSPWTYFLAAGLLLAVAVASQFDLVVPSRSEESVDEIAALADRDDLNVLFVLVDTLRADRLGMYGYERDTSPVLDALASRGVVFKHVLSQSSWTKSSMASLWTATNPAKNGILKFDHTLPEEIDMPAEILQRAGFRTAGIWRNSWVATNFGFGQGFDTYMRPMSSPQRARIYRSSPSSRSINGTDADVIDAASGFLRHFGNERFMLYLHLMDLHQYVFDDDSPNFGGDYSDIYDRSVNRIDRAIGGLLYEVDELGLLDETIVVISSDHGEAFREHGFEGHARNLYSEVIEVPMIISLPFLLEEGIVVEPLVANVDVWPTILDMIGLPPMKGVDGVSQLPLILEAGGASSRPSMEGLVRPVFAQLDKSWGEPKKNPDPLVSVVDDRVRLIFRVKRPDEIELYDRSADPDDQHDVAAERADELARYRALAEAYLEDDAPPWEVDAGTVEIDEMQLNQLRALGYHLEH